MNKKIGIAVLPVLLFSTLFASQALADSLGTKMAYVVCANLKGGQSYTLSSSEAQTWTQTLLSGGYDSAAISTTFYKGANYDDASCIVKKSPSWSCSNYSVTRSGNKLTLSTTSESCNPVFY